MSSEGPPPRLDAAPLPIDALPTVENVPLSVDMLVDPNTQGVASALPGDAMDTSSHADSSTDPLVAGSPSAEDVQSEEHTPVPPRRLPSTASTHGSEDVEFWQDALATPSEEGEVDDSAQPIPIPNTTVVYLDTFNAQSFMDTYEPHAHVLPRRLAQSHSTAQQQLRTLGEHIGRGKAQRVQLEYQYARFYHELTQILETAVSLEREAALQWTSLADQQRAIQNVLLQAQANRDQLRQLQEVVQQR